MFGPLAPFLAALLIAAFGVWLFARLALRIGAVSKVKSNDGIRPARFHVLPGRRS